MIDQMSELEKAVWAAAYVQAFNSYPSGATRAPNVQNVKNAIEWADEMIIVMRKATTTK